MKTLHSLFGAVILAAALPAAQLGGPPAEMAKLEVMLGSWEGSGTFSMGEGLPAQGWTAQSVVRKIMGDHFIQEDMAVNVGMPTPIVFRTIFSWDAHTSRYQYFSVDNSGAVDDGYAYWTEDGKLITSGMDVEEGVPVASQWVSAYGQDGYTLVARHSAGGGDFETFVAGSMKRSQADFEVPVDIQEPFMEAPGEAMTKLAALLGEWKIKGKASMMPGMPAVEISGTENNRLVLGGYVHMGVIHGDALPGTPAYQENWYMGWDKTEACYQGLAVDNFGGCHRFRGYLVGPSKMVMISTPIVMGVPHAQRGVMEFDKAKQEIRYSSDRCAGDLPAERAFEAVSTRSGAN